MTSEQIQAMIKAGDEQKCHVFHDGLHYFKFGSYWIVESVTSSFAPRVFGDIVYQLDNKLEELRTGKVAEAPVIEAEFRCKGCRWEGEYADLDFLPPDMTVHGISDFCPECGGSDLVRLSLPGQ